MYREYWYDDPNNAMVLQKTWTDSLTYMQHYRYQQTFYNLDVEGAEFIEHAQNGYLTYANGRVADGIEYTLEVYKTELECWGNLMDSLNDYVFKWDSLQYEDEIKIDLNDSNATYLPTGKLLWALKPDYELNPTMDGQHYVLAWQFEISAITPDEHRFYYVNAITGNILKYTETQCTNGPANIMNIGSRTIDTRWKGGFTQKHILWANDNYGNIHTKKHKERAWGIRQEVKDKDDNWGGSEPKATTAHWVVTQSWDFFQSFFKRNGMSGSNSKEIRVESDWGDANAKYHQEKNSKDYLTFGTIGGYMAILDVAGHEFGHGVDEYTANLQYEKESGALDESFSDIYGFMVERYAQPYPWNWTLGEKATTLRDMSDPKAYNQPDTYLDSNWFNVVGCTPHSGNDNCGVHTNSGVQNFWFYLLSIGGSSTNGIGNNYTVFPIGMDKAAKIAYHSHTNNHGSYSTYLQARAYSIASVISIHGKCSNEYNQVLNAWHAVGIGKRSACVSNALNQHTVFENKPLVYPNPSSSELNIDFMGNEIKSVKLVSANGSVVKNIENVNTSKLRLSISDIATGIYYVQVRSEYQVYTIKVIKN